MAFPAGHFYSPLLDLQSLRPGESAPPCDGEEMWEHLDLRGPAQRAYYLDLLGRFPAPPFPDRLNALLTAADRARSTVLVQPVQSVPLAVFDRLEERDILFIDSSHVAKIGSDVAFLLLRVLPRLKRGVLIHFHDIFYPYSYPAGWVREGRAWNESLFLRAFLLGHPAFEIVAFNSFAGRAFPEIFRAGFPPFLDNTGGSIWLRKVS